jgi:hypothetical protein
MDKEQERKFMEKIKKAANPENYETSWDEKGLPTSKKKTEIKKGKISKAKGQRFELKVRRDLEEKGRFVDKWNNNVDLENNKIIIAKKKYNPFKKMMTLGTGFPDFIAFKRIYAGTYSIIGVESKINGILSKIEKEKCKWYLNNKVFADIWIAKAKKKGRKIEVEYVDFREKYMKKCNNQ